MNQNVFRSNRHDNCDDGTWSALDPESRHPFACNINDNVVEQEAVQVNSQVQISEELIYIKDSCDVRVTTVDTKAAVAMQEAIQQAIVVILSIAINDTNQANLISQELIQATRSKQVTRQKTIVENSRGVHVSTSDEQTASINQTITLLLQVLITLVTELGISG